MGDWSDYRYFLALARAGTLAGAARDLGVEHSTVSRRIAALETSLATKLFIRTPDGFVLTAAGMDALPRIEAAAKAIEAVELRVTGEDAELRGKVRITASDAISGFLLKRLGPMRAKYPDIVVEFLTGNQFFDLARREADLAVRAAPAITGSDLVARKLGDAGWGLYATAEYLARKPFTDDFAGHDVIGYLDGNVYPGMVWLGEHARAATMQMQVNTIPSAVNALLTGAGIGTLPCLIGEVESTLVRVIPDVLGTRPLWLVVHPDLVRVARIRATMDAVIEIATAEAFLLAGKR